MCVLVLVAFYVLYLVILHFRYNKEDIFPHCFSSYMRAVSHYSCSRDRIFSETLLESHLSLGIKEHPEVSGQQLN